MLATKKRRIMKKKVVVVAVEEETLWTAKEAMALVLFTLPQVLLKIMLAVDVCKPLVFSSMTCKAFFRAVWNNHRVIKHMMVCWDPRRMIASDVIRHNRDEEEDFPKFHKFVGLSDVRYMQFVGKENNMTPMMLSSMRRFAQRMLFMKSGNWCGVCGRVPEVCLFCMLDCLCHIICVCVCVIYVCMG